MLANSNYQLNQKQFVAGVNFAASSPAPLTTPIESVQKTIESGVDGFVKTIDEKKKKKFAQLIILT